nr:hypothetical protein [Mycoplasmopsis bovis]
MIKKIPNTGTLKCLILCLQLSRFYALMPLWKLGLITAGLAILFGVVGIFLG